MSAATVKIALFDTHAADQAFYRKAFGAGFELVMSEAGLTADTAPLAASAEVVSTHVTSQVSAAMMELMPRLRHIACRSTGYDNVDLAFAKARGITVSTVPSYGEDTVAEYAFLLLLAVSRRLMLAAHSVHAGTVTPEKLTGHDLAGKTLGVIGTGRIGRHAAKIGRGFGMTVLAYDPFPNEAAAAEIGFEYRSLAGVLASSDCLTLHAPATPETHHLLDASAFGRMKSGVFIVNTARGTLIDTPALIDALGSGKVAAAGLDVLEGEEYLQLAEEAHLMSEKKIGAEARSALGIDILTKMPNVLITAHNAYNSAEALSRIRDVTVANVKAWQSGSSQNLVG